MLAGISIILLLTFTLHAYLSYRSQFNIFKNELSQQFSKANEQAAARLELRVKEINRISNYVVFNPIIETTLLEMMRGEISQFEDYSQKVQMSKLLNQIKLDEPKIISLFLFDLTGKNHYVGHMQNPVNQIDSASFAVILEAVNQTIGETVWMRLSLPSVVEQSGFRSVIVASRWMNSNEAGRYGIMTMVIDETFFTELFQELISADNSEVSLLSPRKHSLYTNVSGNSVSSESLLTYSNQSIISESNGRLYLYAKHQTHDQFSLISRVSINEFFSEIRQFFKTSLFLAAISIMLSGFLIVLLTQQLLKPLTFIIKAMRSMKKGNLDSRIEVKTLDEFQMIGENFNAMADHVQQLIKEVYERRLNEQEAELKAIQAQLNPHFLYNTLNGLYWKLYLKDEKETAHLVSVLSEMMRYSLESVDQPTILAREIEMIRNYIALRLAFIDTETEFIIRIHDEVQFCSIQGLLLQPLVENLFIHAFKDFEGVQIVLISAHKSEDEKLIITIKDNGHGMSGNTIKRIRNIHKEPQASIGIQSVIKRVELVHGSPYGVEIDSAPGAGTMISLTLPFQTTGGGTVL
ncbi:hypothetical protein BK133_25130 [Paenibacillus sp. FSL H8-0548]|uniref:cache domain-containing sensor histidine kinase n=1 Tax=Paenibacillus sp. FSL H8-0548 TaxID=1920422 RepID=UPI00096CFF26|nr:histidine kinase [Paenibacillus sp. FSL H8-0548]OMF22938.1 hypothetical protein BK133_25130 [Paenibacillus sp. FSL H8-0548]